VKLRSVSSLQNIIYPMMILSLMPIFRREFDHEKRIATYHCDEHQFKASDAAHVEEHMKLHGKTAGNFWKRVHHHERRLTVFHCDHHDFQSYDPLEIEEHEKLHALLPGGWGLT